MHVKPLVASLFAVTALSASLSASPARRTFIGTVTDEMCALVGHAHMQMGPTDAECATACVSAHGANYVLEAGKTVYVLTGQHAAEPLAGRKVRVVGTLDAKTHTIYVLSIAPAK